MTTGARVLAFREVRYRCTFFKVRSDSGDGGVGDPAAAAVLTVRQKGPGAERRDRDAGVTDTSIVSVADPLGEVGEVVENIGDGADGAHAVLQDGHLAMRRGVDHLDRRTAADVALLSVLFRQ